MQTKQQIMALRRKEIHVVRIGIFATRQHNHVIVIHEKMCLINMGYNLYGASFKHLAMYSGFVTTLMNVIITAVVRTTA